MSVQKFHGTINTDGIKDERGIETPSLSATGEVAGQTGVFTESVTAPAFSGDLTGDVTGDLTGTAAKATADAEGNVIPTTYATKEELAEETSAREAADNALQQNINSEASTRESADTALGGRIDDIVDGTTVVGKATSDGNGNNIPETYATQTALSSGLAGKANTSGTYSGLTVGNATNADLASSVENGETSSTYQKYANLKLCYGEFTIDPTNQAQRTQLILFLGTHLSLEGQSEAFPSFLGARFILPGATAYSGLCPASYMFSQGGLTIYTGNGKGISWSGAAADSFTTFGGETLPAAIRIQYIGIAEG